MQGLCAAQRRIAQVFKIQRDELFRTDAGIQQLLLHQLEHDGLPAAADAGHHLDQFAADKRTNAAHIGFSLDHLAGLPSWLVLFYQSVSEKTTEI